MKKILLFILTICLSLCLFASCSDSDKDNAGNQGQSGATGEEITGGATVWSMSVVPTIVKAEDDIFKLSDNIYVHIKTATGKSPELADSVSPDKSNYIVVGNVDCDLAKEAYKKFESYVNVDDLFDNRQSAWLIYVKNGSVAIAYSDILAKKDAIDYLVSIAKGVSFAPANGVLAKETLEIDEYIQELRALEQSSEMEAIGSVLGSDALKSFKKLYSIFDQDLYIWLANLWCPDNGGFYYSVSARNNEGFLPDLESTGQALGTLDRSGLSAAYSGKWANMLPDDVKVKLLSFAKDMQAEDHYFYHPQWGTSINRSRRGRDAGWARTIITGLGGTPNYSFIGDTSVENMSRLTQSLNNNDKAVAVSKVVAVAASDAIYNTKESFIAYLDSLKFSENSYSAGNAINSTVSAIKNHGHWDTLRNYLTEHQNKENGLWEEEVSYQSVNGLMKLCTCFGSSFPNAEKALDSAIEILLKPLDDELTGITYVYNPWVAIANLLNAVSHETKAELRKMLYSNAADIFTMTNEKLSAFAKDDGGFSYLRDYSSPFSQEALVAVSGSAESDVNATSIAISTVVRYMEEVFDLTFPTIYSKYESVYFLDTLTGLGSIIKDSLLSTPPEVITFDDYVQEDAQIDGNVVIRPVNGVMNNLGSTESDGDGYKWFESAVVPNPSAGADPKDLVLYVADKVYTNDKGETDIAETQSSTTFEILNMGAPGNCYIFEADILFDGTSDMAAPVMQIMYYRNGSSLNSAWVNLYQYERFGQKFLRIEENNAGKDGVKDKEVAAGIPCDDWFKLRIEMYKDYSGEGSELEIKLKIFIDGEYVGTSDAGHYADGAYKDFLVNAVKLAYYRQAASAFYLNNIYVAKSSKNYEAEKVDVSDSSAEIKDKFVWDFESGIPSVNTNFTEMFYKHEVNGSTSIYADKWTAELEEIYGGSKSPGAKIYPDKDPQNFANNVIRAYSFNTKSNSYIATMYVDDVLTAAGGKTWEVEFDYFFDKLLWIYSPNFFSVNFQNINGSSVAGVVFEGLGWEDTHKTETLGIKLSDGTRLTNFALNDATWYSFKFVYHYDEEKPSESKLLIYVKAKDGYACLANTTLPAKIDKIERVGFSFLSYDIRGTQYIDNVSVSRTALEYDHSAEPVEGQITIPEGEDTKIYVDSTSRGEGSYGKNAEKFENVTFESLVNGGKMAANQKRGDGVADGTRELSFETIGDNGVLVYKSLASGNHALNFIAEQYAYAGFVFETDIKLKDVDTEDGRDIRFTGTTSNGVADSSLYGLNLKFHKNPKDSVGGYIITINGNEQTNYRTKEVYDSQKVVIKEDTWVNVRLVANGLKAGDAIELYVNNELVITAKLTSSIEGIRGVELFTPSTYNGHGWEQGSVYIDNLYATGTGEAPDRESISESSRGEGKHTENAINYTGVTYEQLVSQKRMAENTSRGDGLFDGVRTLAFADVDKNAALVYTASGSGNKAINFISQSPAIDGFVFETDLMLDGVNAELGREICFRGSASNGSEDSDIWALNIKISKHYLDEIDGYLLTVAGLKDFEFVIPDKTWVNIRLVVSGLSAKSKATISVNSVEKEFELTASIKPIKGIELYTASDNSGKSGFTRGSIYLDNTYVSGTGTYTKPQEITTTQRGQGMYADKAISFGGITYDELISKGYMAKNTARTDGTLAGKRILSFADVDSNAALTYTANGSGNYSLNFPVQSKAYSGFVFETDIKLSGINNDSTRDISFTGTSSNGGADASLWGINIKFARNPDALVGGYLLTVSGLKLEGSDADWKGVISDNTWINIRFEATSLKKGGAFNFYVNGQKVGNGTLSASISSIRGIELYTASTNGGIQGFTKGSILLDNTYVSGTGEPTTNVQFESITTSQRGDGEYIESAISYEGMTFEKLVSDGKMVVNTKYGETETPDKENATIDRTVSFADVDENTALVYKSLLSGTHSLNFAKQGNMTSGFVFETDIMLDGINATLGREIAFVGTSSNGAQAPDITAITIKIFKDYVAGNQGYILTVNGINKEFFVADKAWINIRFEALSLANGGTFNFYINGENVGSGKLSSSISNLAGIELYTLSTSTYQGWTAGSIYLDNTCVLGISKSSGTGSETTDTENGTMNGDNIDKPGWVEN